MCGGSAYLGALAVAIEKRARVPVTLFDPMANLNVDAKNVNEADLRSRASQMVVAIGLALRCERERRAA
jgi:type IV pilus assembly protein PilM